MNAERLARANRTSAARLRSDVLGVLSQVGARADFVEVDDPMMLALRVHAGLSDERTMRLHGLLARLQGVVGAPLQLEHGVLLVRFQSEDR